MLWQGAGSISPGDTHGPVPQLPTAAVPPLSGFALPCGTDSLHYKPQRLHLWKHLMIQEPAAPWGWFPLPPEFLPRWLLVQKSPGSRAGAGTTGNVFAPRFVSIPTILIFES